MYDSLLERYDELVDKIDSILADGLPDDETELRQLYSELMDIHDRLATEFF